MQRLTDLLPTVSSDPSLAEIPPEVAANASLTQLPAPRYDSGPMSAARSSPHETFPTTPHQIDGHKEGV